MSLRTLSPELEALKVPIGDIHTHPENANNGDTEAIVESMVRDGIYRTVYYSRATGNIVAGNHTYLAQVSEGATHVPAIPLDLDYEGELRVLAKDNQIARMAWMDPGLELALVKKIAATPQGLLGTGYPDGWLEKALAAAATPYVPGSAAPNTRDVTCPNCDHTFEIEVDDGF